jgi:hypothetical protein
MSSTATKTTQAKSNKNLSLDKLANNKPLFNKYNFILMLVGAACMILGMLVMGGGKSPQGEFKPDEVYSSLRITIAPLLIIIGLAIIGYGIFATKKEKQD